MGVANPTGMHDFDLRVGQWKAHHRRLKERLAGSHEWEGFDGTQTLWQLMDGLANVDDNVFQMPDGNKRRYWGPPEYSPAAITIREVFLEARGG